ncbi:MAG: MerR family transcriptional regulator [Polyangiales bacterium]
MSESGENSEESKERRRSRPPGESYTIDELAAETGVPSRTIRFYQSKGVLRPPQREGRIAYYDHSHIEQLKRVGELKDKGLTIRAVRDLLNRIERGELMYSDWLGVEKEIETPWVDDRAQVLEADDLSNRIGSQRKGVLSVLEKMGVIEKRGLAFFVPSMARLNLVLQLDKAGLDLETASEAGEILERHVSRAAKELVEFFTKQFESGYVSGNTADIPKVLGILKKLSMSAVTLTFARSIQDEMRKVIQSGRATIGLKKK